MLVQVLASELHASSLQSYWVFSGYLLASAVLQPPLISLSLTVGCVLLLFTTIIFFMVGSIICATAHSMQVFLVGRCFQGAGSSGVFALTYVLIAKLVDFRSRGKWIGFIAMAFALGTVLGPLFGGYLAMHSSWVSSTTVRTPSSQSNHGVRDGSFGSTYLCVFWHSLLFQ
jgi:MFS family permease